ncbi:MAG: alpha/beta fold hydrolase [Phycisphaerales bacterium JB061]
MAPLIALLSILLGGESEAVAAPVPESPAAIVEVSHVREMVALQPEVETPDGTRPDEERWLGQVEIPGQVIDFAVTIVEIEGRLAGNIDIPAQGLMGGQLHAVEREGDELRFVFAIPNQPEAVWPKWVVTIDEDGTSASGALHQSGGVFPTTMTLDETGRAEILTRPQHPKRPFPYAEIEVTIDAGEHTLAGTLTVPSEEEFGKGPFPGAVLITGSGPQDRDETIMGHKPFLVLSDQLTRRGIAVLRYDDRGFGGSTGDFARATTLDFAEDAKACARWIRRRPEVDRVAIIGHSEGGLIAPFVANGNADVDCVVLLAGPGVPGREVLMRQMRDLSAAGGLDDETIDKQSVMMERVYDLLLSEADEADVRAEIEKLVRLQLGVGPEEQDRSITDAVDQTHKQVTGPWWQQFLTLDPRPALREMTQPVMALNGSLDLQVAADQNLAEIERVFEEAGKSDQLTAIEFEGLNHLFQPATTGSMDEYGQIETTFDEGVIEKMASWIIENVR